MAQYGILHPNDPTGLPYIVADTLDVLAPMYRHAAKRDDVQLVAYSPCDRCDSDEWVVCDESGEPVDAMDGHTFECLSDLMEQRMADR